jgi:hypothetical protein
MNASRHPFRDELAAAIHRAEWLARENARLRGQRAARGLDSVQCTLIGILALCAAAIPYILL